jgi:hypothetical protein
MPGSLELKCIACLTGTLLLVATLGTGCGSSDQGASGATTGRSAAADPQKPRSITPRDAPDSADGLSSPASSSPAGNPTRPKAHRAIPPAHPVPAAFRPARGAPSDAEVRAQLAQLDAIQRAEHQRALSAAAASLAGLLPWSMEPRSGTQVSVASVFRDYGLGLACGGVLGREQLGVAHKTAPCGTLITFTYAGRSLTVPVIDRGPFIAGREWDLTGATAAALAFPGLGQIQWSVAR